MPPPRISTLGPFALVTCRIENWDELPAELAARAARTAPRAPSSAQLRSFDVATRTAPGALCALLPIARRRAVRTRRATRARRRGSGREGRRGRRPRRARFRLCARQRGRAEPRGSPRPRIRAAHPDALSTSPAPRTPKLGSGVPRSGERRDPSNSRPHTEPHPPPPTMDRTEHRSPTPVASA